jgi:rRNA maturation endonuclease Nob1
MTLARAVAESNPELYAPVGPPTSLAKRRAINEVSKELRIRRLRQGDHVEAGEIRAAECAQEAIESMENELQFLVGSR